MKTTFYFPDGFRSITVDGPPPSIGSQVILGREYTLPHGAPIDPGYDYKDRRRWRVKDVNWVIRRTKFYKVEGTFVPAEAEYTAEVELVEIKQP